jgi:hypothetical protein
MHSLLVNLLDAFSINPDELRASFLQGRMWQSIILLGKNSQRNSRVRKILKFTQSYKVSFKAVPSISAFALLLPSIHNSLEYGQKTGSP